MIAGRYTLGREVGRGGSGVVHLAHDEVLGRDVALKRIGMVPGADSPDLVRAEREARLAAALNHPHVVAVFDLVEDEGDHWLVMEYVAGSTLAQMSRDEGGLPPQRAAELVAQAADALAAAHGAGIVHRDVKPSNILVAADGQAKLTDFGIARARADASLTQTGLVTGSPAYLAPEVASGASATTASDVWSLGATLYQAATGHPPYDVGDNLVGGLYRIVHEEPPRLPEGHPLAPLLAATMVKDPAGRWSMERFRDALRQVAGGDVAAAAVTRALATPTASAPATTPAPEAERTGVLPAAPRPDPTPAPAGRGQAPRHLDPRWLAGALAAVLAVALLVWLWPDGDSREPTAGTPDRSQPAAEEPTATDTGATAADTEREMARFVTDYLDTVTSDHEAAFAMLTPAFQEASGGIDGYTGWWSTVASATPRDVTADAEALTVDYTVDYVMETGRRSTDSVRLRLVRQDDAYLIDGEG